MRPTAEERRAVRGLICYSETHRDGTEDHDERCFATAATQRDAALARLEATEALLRAVHEERGNIHFSMLWDDWFAKRDALLAETKVVPHGT